MWFFGQKGLITVYRSATISEQNHSTAPAKPNCRSFKGQLKQRENTLIPVKLQCNVKNANQDMSTVHIKAIIIRSGPVYQNKQKNRNILKSKKQNLSSTEQRHQILVKANDSHLKNPASQKLHRNHSAGYCILSIITKKEQDYFSEKSASFHGNSIIQSG